MVETSIGQSAPKAKALTLQAESSGLQRAWVELSGSGGGNIGEIEQLWVNDAVTEAALSGSQLVWGPSSKGGRQRI